MNIKAALLIFLFALWIFLPIFSDPLLERTSDLDGMVTQIIFIKETLVKNHIFPQWNPYINQGIPVSADPLHAAFHPLVLPVFMLFSPDIAVKILYFLSVFIGGMGMYMLLLRLKLFPVLAGFAAASYISSGYMISHLVAGHFEKILSFAFLPWFITYLYQVYKKPQTSHEVVTACCMALILYSGDLYNALYSCIFVVAAGFIRFRRSAVFASIRILLYFLLLSSIKLLPLIELQQYIEKVKEPFAGGQNLVSILYYFFVPIKQIFISIGAGEFLQTGFAWWEKMAYIGPIYLLGLILLCTRRNIRKNMQLQFFLGILVVAILLAMPHLTFNPLNWILRSVPPLQLFHVPSRIFGYVTVLFLILGTLGFQKIYVSISQKQRYVLTGLLFFNLLSATLFTLYVLGPMNMGFRHSNASTELIHDIKRRDRGVFYIAQYLQEEPLSQHRLISSKQKILNSNYGLQLKDSPAAKFTRFDFATNNTYVDIQPKYLVGRRAIRVPKETLPLHLIKKDTTHIYKNAYADQYAKLSLQDKNLLKPEIFPNSIKVSINSDRQDTLTVVESYYPGWRATMDGHHIELKKDRFLMAPVSKGTHTYHFTFHSSPFIDGLAISCIAWSCALGTLLKEFKRTHL